MKAKRCCYSLTVCFGFVWASVASAGQGHEHVHQHGSHVHGVAQIMAAYEGQQLEIQFKSPAMNLIGFERKAATSEEKKAVREAEAVLKETATLFSFKGATCVAIQAKVDLSDVISDNHDSHDHAHQHNHGDQHGGHTKHSEHSEIEGSYSFECKQPGKLEGFSTSLLTHFTGIETIEVQWVTELAQGAVTLNSQQNNIPLR